MKLTKTRSYSLPAPIVEQLDNLAGELNVSTSALLTGMLSIMLKWNLKEMLENVKRRQA